MTNKLEELMNAAKINDLMRRRNPMEKKKNTFVCVLAIMGAVALVAAIAYAVYRYMNPDYLDDFDDDFDDYEEMFSDDDEEGTIVLKSDSTNSDTLDFESELSDDDYESEE